MLFSLCDFGSPYSRGVVASLSFQRKTGFFVTFLLSSKLVTNLLTSWVVDAMGWF